LCHERATTFYSISLYFGRRKSQFHFIARAAEVRFWVGPRRHDLYGELAFVGETDAQDDGNDGESVPPSRENASPDHDHENNDEKDTKHKNAEGGPSEDKKDEKHSKLPLIIGGVAVAIALIAALIYWLATRNEQTTDDAYTDGREISIAANVSGYTTALYVTDNSFVRAGQLLLVIDPRDAIAEQEQDRAAAQLAQSQLASAEVNLQVQQVQAPAQLQEAQAQLAQARANEVVTHRDYLRQLNVDQRATAGSDIDQAAAQLRSAEASVKSAQAQVAVASLVPQSIATAQEAVKQRRAQLAQAAANLAQAQVKLSYSYIRAPQDGSITMRNVERGTYVQAGQQVFYIVPPLFWVVANFKETQLSRMRVGDRVALTVDAYPSLKLYGHIDSIQQGSGAQFSAFPAENATGNFVKIVRRVPVKIIIDRGMPRGFTGLPLGISVEPTVYLK
jgi:membrane fusion protein, multidrug efflux system